MKNLYINLNAGDLNCFLSFCASYFGAEKRLADITEEELLKARNLYLRGIDNE